MYADYIPIVSGQRHFDTNVVVFKVKFLNLNPCTFKGGKMIEKVFRDNWLCHKFFKMLISVNGI